MMKNSESLSSQRRTQDTYIDQNSQRIHIGLFSVIKLTYGQHSFILEKGNKKKSN